MIDIELIVKLIKLANNNPNDNEANLAARKACKMLMTDKGEFIFRVVKQRAGPDHLGDSIFGGFRNQGFNPFYERQRKDPYQAREESRKRYTEAQAAAEEQARRKRTEEEKKKEEKKPSANYGYAYYDEEMPFDWSPNADFVNEVLRGFKNEHPLYQSFGGRRGGKSSTEKRKLACIKCHKTQETGYIGLPESFICMDCRGKGL